MTKHKPVTQLDVIDRIADFCKIGAFRMDTNKVDVNSKLSCYFPYNDIVFTTLLINFAKNYGLDVNELTESINTDNTIEELYKWIAIHQKNS